MTIGNIFLIILLIALNAFFVGIEFSIVSSRRSRLDLLPAANSPAGQLVRNWLDQIPARDRLIAASQLGITVVSLALGAVGENAFEVWLETFFENIKLPVWLGFLEYTIAFLPLVISLVVVSGMHVVLGEQVPKVAVLRNPEKFAIAAAPFMQVFNIIFKWFIDVLDALTHLILRCMGLPTDSSHSTLLSIEEIKQIVSGPDTEGVIEPSGREMLSAVIDFGDLVVRQISIPRFEMISVEAGTKISEVIRLAAQNNITKLPVYETSLEQVMGIVHVLDILQALQENPANGDRTAGEMAREALFVPETISVIDLLNQFRNRRTHMAIVLDEFGGTAGLVTLEALLEEIFGEVQDAFDVKEMDIQPMPDGTALVDGMTLMENFNEFFRLSLEDPNYDTIAGYILGKLGRIPQVGDVVEDNENGIRLKVESMDRLRISQVTMTRL